MKKNNWKENQFEKKVTKFFQKPPKSGEIPMIFFSKSTYNSLFDEACVV